MVIAFYGFLLNLTDIGIHFRHSLSIANTSIEHCSLSCQNDGLVPIFFSVETRHYLRLWTGAWAVACCVCTFFTIITFLIDLDRFLCLLHFYKLDFQNCYNNLPIFYHPFLGRYLFKGLYHIFSIGINC